MRRNAAGKAYDAGRRIAVNDRANYSGMIDGWQVGRLE